VLIHVLINVFHAAVAQLLLQFYATPATYLGTQPHSIFGIIDHHPALATLPDPSMLEVYLTGFGFDLVPLALGASIPERILLPLLFMDPFLINCLDPHSPVKFYRETYFAFVALACILYRGKWLFLCAGPFIVLSIACRAEFLGVALLVVYRGFVCCADPTPDDYFVTTCLVNAVVLALSGLGFLYLFQEGLVESIADISDRINRSVLKKLIETDTFGIAAAFAVLIPIFGLLSGRWAWSAFFYLVVLFSLDLPFVSAVGQEYSAEAVIRLLIYVSFVQVTAKQNWKLRVLAIIALIGNTVLWHVSSLHAWILAKVIDLRSNFYGVD
jgi:hypothetical protein